MANVSGMAMNFPEGLRTEVDSSIELTTTVEDGAPANRLSGLVTIKRGAYREPLALVTGLLNNLRRAGTTTGSPPSPFLQSLTLDVRVITDEDLVIDNNVAKAQLGADLRVINVASAPALSGRAELREGGQLFLGTEHLRRAERDDRLRQPIGDRTDTRDRGHHQSVRCRHRCSHHRRPGQPDDRAHLAIPSRTEQSARPI